MSKRGWLLAGCLVAAAATVATYLVVTWGSADEEAFGFDFATAQGWTPDLRPESNDRGITDAHAAKLDGKPCLMLKVDLRQDDAKRRAGEVSTLLYGSVREVSLEVYAPDGSAYDAHRPPGVQVFLKDDGFRCHYGQWRNIGHGAASDYPIRPGKWNRVVMRPAKGGKADSADGRIAAGFDPDRCMIVGVKIALSGQARPNSALKGAFAIRNVTVRRRAVADEPGRALDFAAQAGELKAWRRAATQASRPAAATDLARGPFGANRPYFFCDPGWKAHAWTDRDVSIVQRGRRKVLAIRADFRCGPDTPAADPKRQGYVRLMFEPNLNLDPDVIKDNRLFMDLRFEPAADAKDPRYPGPLDLAAKLAVYSRSSGLAPEKAWHMSPLTYVGGVGRCRVALTPKVGYAVPAPGAKRQYVYGPWAARANRAILFVGCHVYANRPWRGTILIEKVRLGGAARRIDTKLRGIVRPRGRRFALNGKDFAVRGCNVSFLTQKSPYVIDRALRQVAAAGFNTIRAWGFADGRGPGGFGNEGYALQPRAGVFDEASFRHLDFFCAAAERHGLRVILPLVNYWSDNEQKGRPENRYGGVGLYMDWAGVKLNYDGGGHLRNRHGFFTDARCRALFKAYVKHVVTRVNVYTHRRYGDAPGILAFELINEPRGAAGGAMDAAGRKRARARADALAEWVGEMARFIKADCKAKTMVAVGDEGFLFGDGPPGSAFHNGSHGIDWAKNLRLVDFGTVHMYPEHWGWTPSQCAAWIDAHTAIAAKANKPCVFEEFGLCDFSPRPAEDAAGRRRRQAEAYRQLASYRAARGGSRADADRAFRRMHPTLKVVSDDPRAGLADEAKGPDRGAIYRDWIARMEKAGAGWVIWQAVGPRDDDTPVRPPRECDWFSLSIGDAAGDRLLKAIGAGRRSK